MKEKSYAFKVATTSTRMYVEPPLPHKHFMLFPMQIGPGLYHICYSVTLNDSVYIYLTSEFSTPIHSASTTGTFQYYNHNMTLPLNKSETFFILKDAIFGNQKKDASFELTLLPATIGMTVSTSTAGYNYNAAGTAITGSYNDTISPYLGPYQLKYGEQLNFSCDNTTRYGIYSDNKVGFTFTTHLTSDNTLYRNYIS